MLVSRRFCWKVLNCLPQNLLADITFTDIEKVTGLSRGAILYHFKSKDEILASIIDRFIINKEYDLPTIDVSKSMWDNIKNFIAVKQRQQEFFTSIGIQNINMCIYLYCCKLHESFERNPQ